MNTWVKASVMSLTIMSAIGLSACQSSATATPEKPHKSLQHRADDLRKPFDRESKRMHKLTAEERAKFEQKMQEHRTQHDADRKTLQQACEGKAGQTISVKLGKRTVEGKCEIRFQPNKPEQSRPPATQKNAPAA